MILTSSGKSLNEVVSALQGIAPTMPCRKKVVDLIIVNTIIEYSNAPSEHGNFVLHHAYDAYDPYYYGFAYQIVQW